jgi:hypothetical protein
LILNKSHSGAGKPSTQPSPNEVRFDEDVKALLAENHPHHKLKQRLHQLVMEEAQKLPPTKVLYCASYGGFACSAEFRAFLDSRSLKTYPRSDPALIQAISDYARLICDKFPFILDDMRTVYTWKLDKVLAKLKKEEFHPVEMELDPDLVAEATSFIDQMGNPAGRWRRRLPWNLPKWYQNARFLTKTLRKST